MSNKETRNSNPKEKNPQKETNTGNPSKPGNDPDQTPEREIENPPVAEPQKGKQKPGKIGF